MADMRLQRGPAPSSRRRRSPGKQGFAIPADVAPDRSGELIGKAVAGFGREALSTVETVQDQRFKDDLAVAKVEGRMAGLRGDVVDLEELEGNELGRAIAASSIDGYVAKAKSEAPALAAEIARENEGDPLATRKAWNEAIGERYGKLPERYQLEVANEIEYLGAKIETEAKVLQIKRQKEGVLSDRLESIELNSQTMEAAYQSGDEIMVDGAIKGIRREADNLLAEKLIDDEEHRALLDGAMLRKNIADYSARLDRGGDEAWMDFVLENPGIPEAHYQRTLQIYGAERGRRSAVAAQAQAEIDAKLEAEQGLREVKILTAIADGADYDVTEVPELVRSGEVSEGFGKDLAKNWADVETNQEYLGEVVAAYQAGNYTQAASLAMKGIRTRQLSQTDGKSWLNMAESQAAAGAAGTTLKMTVSEKNWEDAIDRALRIPPGILGSLDLTELNPRRLKHSQAITEYGQRVRPDMWGIDAEPEKASDVYDDIMKRADAPTFDLGRGNASPEGLLPRGFEYKNPSNPEEGLNVKVSLGNLEALNGSGAMSKRQYDDQVLLMLKWKRTMKTARGAGG